MTELVHKINSVQKKLKEHEGKFLPHPEIYQILKELADLVEHLIRKDNR